MGEASVFVNLVQINHFKSEYSRFAKTATNGNILEKHLAKRCFVSIFEHKIS